MAINLGGLEQLPEHAQTLLRRARLVAPNSYNAYSDYLVGAAVITGEGEIFAGAFFENASYGMTICAEPAAILAANSAGHRDIRTIAVVGGSPNGEDMENAPPCTPCGRCRQILAEVAYLNGREVEVYAGNLQLTRLMLMTSGELLPYAFGPHSLDH